MKSDMAEEEDEVVDVVMREDLERVKGLGLVSRLRCSTKCQN